MAITRDEAIALAERRMHPLIVKFDQQLLGKVTSLRHALAGNDMNAALMECHSLAGEAATFGWANVGQHAANLRTVIQNTEAEKREELLEVGIQALDMLAQLPMKEEETSGQSIVEEFAAVIAVLEQRANDPDREGDPS